MGHIKYHVYPGRWQSPHLGHRYIIDKRLAKDEPVLIMIRSVPIDENNPFTPYEIQAMLRKAFGKEIVKGLVSIMVIPDIASINTGRGAGFEMICLEDECPEDIKRISATEIRRQIKAGETGWKDLVMKGVEKDLEEKFNENS